MKNICAALVLACFAAAAFAADIYTFDPRHTRPLFEVNHMGFSTQHGRFGKAEGRVVIDMAARKGSVDLAIDTASIDMGTDEWNRHMTSDEFFDVGRFPAMTFRSDQLIFDGDRLTGADGSFTLLGVTQPLHIDIANFRCGTNPMNKAMTCGGDVQAAIKRSAFGMRKFLPLVGDDVKIAVPFEATKAF